LFTKTKIFDREYSLEELIAVILRALRAAAEEQFGDVVTSAIVGRPVHFSGTKDEADDELALTRLRVAFNKAGFERVVFLPEPVAAAYKYQSQLDHQELVLIADFGGGTSDFSLVKLSARQTNTTERAAVIGTDGVGIAGDTFDSRMVRNLVAPMLGLGSEYTTPFGKVLPVPFWIYEHLERWHTLSFLKTRQNMETLKEIRYLALEPAKIEALIQTIDCDLGYKLYQAIERTKCRLSDSETGEFTFKEAVIEIETRMSRFDFERWIDEEINAIDGYVDRLLARCKVTPCDIDAVFMTGGSSFVPAIRGIFQKKFGDERIRAGEEFTSVAQGLAISGLADPLF
jgi:hypothetical chaperone protein